MLTKAVQGNLDGFVAFRRPSTATITISSFDKLRMTKARAVVRQGTRDGARHPELVEGAGSAGATERVATRAQDARRERAPPHHRAPPATTATMPVE